MKSTGKNFTGILPNLGFLTVLWLFPHFDPERYVLLALGSAVAIAGFWKHRWLHLNPGLTISAFSGLAIASSMPGFELRPISFIALVPLLVVLSRCSSWKQAIGAGTVCGVTLILYTMAWCSRAFVNYSDVAALTGYVLFLPVALLLAYKVMAFAVLNYWNYKRQFLPTPLFAGATFAALETINLDLYPWFIGLTQTGGLIVQTADVGGLPLVSFIVVFCNASIIAAWPRFQQRKWRPVITQLAPAVVLILLAATYGGIRLSQVEKATAAATASINVAIVQANTSRKVLKGDNALHEQISSTLLQLARGSAKVRPPDLVVFGEGSAPMGYQVGFHADFAQTYAQIAKELNAPVLTDNNHIQRGPEGKPRMWRGAILIAPDGSVMGEYLKRKLVMFGEYLPLEGLFPIVRKLFPFGMRFEPGTEWADLSVDGVGLAPQICFEGIHPELSREYISRGPRLIVNLVNDVWYDSTLQTEQHLVLSTMRSIENRVPMVRATNTGISAYIDAAGRVSGESSPVGLPWGDSREIKLPQMFSLFTHIGNAFGWLCMALIIVGVAVGWKSRSRC